MLNVIKTITRRELKAYFLSPTAYVFIVIFLVLSGFFTFMIGGFFANGEASLSAFFHWFPWLYLVLIPAVGMPMWADERRLGTIELLLTMPVAPWQCIISKFLAGWAFIGIALLLTFPIVITVAYLGRPDYGLIFCGYLGSFLLAGAYLSISCLTSAMTRSQVVSFIVSVVICLFLIISGFPPVTNMLVEWAPAWVIRLASDVSVMPHFESIKRGVIDSRDIIYYLSVMVFSLFSTSLILKNYRAG